MKKLKKIYWMLLIVYVQLVMIRMMETLSWSSTHSLPQLIYPADRKTFPNGFTS